MRIPSNLNWDLTPQQAREQQQALASRVQTENNLPPIHTVAGVDVGFEAGRTLARAAAVVLAFPSLAPLNYAVARKPVTFPYIPGLLAYRELPVVLDALAQLEVEPDLIIADAHGYAHPRRFGFACFLGVLLDKPVIGCAKSILVGHAEAPENRGGAWTPLVDKGEVIGAAVRTKLNTNPIYVSIGNRIDLETSIAYVLRCAPKYRVPETTRLAHYVASGAELKIAKGAGASD